MPRTSANNLRGRPNTSEQSDGEQFEQFRWMPISEIKRWDRNPRKNQAAVGPVAESIRRFGFVAPCVIWRGGNRLVAGHTRLKALESILAADPGFLPQGAPAPGYAPVRFHEFATSTEADAYAIADNRLGELAEWDEAALSDLLKEIKTADAELAGMVGFSETELAKLTIGCGEDTDEVEPDPTEALRSTWQVEVGQVWRVPSRTLPGRIHRVMCGDSSLAEHVERLRAGAKWVEMVTDPPYGVEYDPTWRDEINRGTTKLTGKVLNDDRSDWSCVWALWEPQVAYVWHASMFCDVVLASLAKANLRHRAQIIWRKQHFQLGRGDYHWQHEPCWYAVRKGSKSEWCGDRTQSTVWDIANLNPRGGGGIGDDNPVGHGTQKPLECMARPMRNHFEPGVVVCDPFLGSGTSLIAAERERRVCYGMELSPIYTASILMRAAKIGLDPILE